MSVLTFSIEQDEQEKLIPWQKTHICKSPWWWKFNRRIPNKTYTYKFIPLGIGEAIEVECNFCGKTIDLTDVSKW